MTGAASVTLRDPAGLTPLSRRGKRGCLPLQSLDPVGFGRKIRYPCANCTGDDKFEFRNETINMNRPPPYFPQNQLSPPDEKRYRKFKLIVGLLTTVLLLVIAGVVYGVYYLISAWLT
jgi:hypothetical protein